jgi:zinc protease
LFAKIIPSVYSVFVLACLLLANNQWVQALPVTCYTYKNPVMSKSVSRQLDRICLIETASSQLVLDSWVGVGSVDETPQMQGISHFLEHLLFKGSKGYTVGALDKFFETQGGITNAATSYEFTHYYQVLPTFDWLTSLKAHTALMTTPTFPKQEVDLEREVVVQEMSRAYNSQFAQLFNGFHRLFLRKTAYEHPVLGTPEVIRMTPIADIEGYYQRHYQPNNRVLFMASNLPKETVVATLNLGKPVEISSSPKASLKKSAFPETSGSADLMLEQSDAVKHPLYMVGIPLPVTQQPIQQLAIGVAWQLLFSEEADFFQKNLQPIEGLDTYFSGLHELKNAPYGYWGSTLPDVASLETVLKKWQALNTKLQSSNGVDALLTEPLFQQQKRKLQKQWQLLAESPQEASSFYGEAWTSGQWDLAKNYSQYLDKLTLADVKAAAQSLNLSQVKSMVLLPEQDKSASALVKPEQLKHWQDLLTSVAQVETVGFPSDNRAVHQALERTVLTGIAGGTLVSQPEAKSPTVALQVGLHYAPSTQEEKAVRLVLSKLVGLETQGLDEQAWLQWLTTRGIEANVVAEADSLNFYTKGLAGSEADVRQAMTGLFQPQWNATLFERERLKLVQALETLPQHPQSYLQSVLAEQAFGDLAYRTNREALMQSLKAVKLPQVEALWLQLQQQVPVTVVQAGQYTPDWLATVVQSWFNPTGKRTATVTEGLKLTPLKAPNKGLPKVASAEKMLEVAGQKTVWLGWSWALPPANQSNVLMPFRVLNAHLGQGMSAVLFQEVREKQGLAYEVASKVDFAEKGSMFTLYLGTAPEKVAQAKAIVTTIMQQLAKEPLTEAALAEAKQKVKGRFGMSHSTASDRATLLLRFETLGLGALFDEQYVNQVDAVTAGQIQQMVQTYLKPELGTVVELKAPTSGAVK